jgi:site-specific DNA-methyltransferase (adenine-specific)/adenine-specific DNA-methyltransferase
VVIGPINLPVGRLFVEEVITECRKRSASRVDVLAFEFEMGLFPAALDEARGKGLDLVPKYIPAEVFDKRAVDNGQVVFHDISFVEATPRYDRKLKLAERVELTDFSVYYTQGAADAAIAALKDGKSQVLCEQGQLWKVSKRKDGVVGKELPHARHRELELKTAEHVYERPGRYTVAVKVIDLFGNDTMTLVPVTVG